MPQVNIPGVGLVDFPDSMSGDQIGAAAKRLHDEANLSSTREDLGGVSPLAVAAGASRVALPVAQRAAEEIATSPYMSALGQTAGRLAGGSAGMKTGGYIGMEAGKVLGGAVGRGAANLAQRGAGVLATGLEAVAPYVNPLLTGVTVAQLLPHVFPSQRDLDPLEEELMRRDLYKAHKSAK